MLDLLGDGTADLVSDLLLAYGSFVDPPTTPVVSGLVMTTYLGGQLLIALLGVLNAGAAFVPLDPDLPVARVRALLAEACAGRPFPR